MSYVVVWNPRPTEYIDEVWSSASDEQRHQIGEALVDIERTLSLAPMLIGESRENDFIRVTSRAPVTVHYRVDEDEQLVRVFAARVYQAPSE